MPPQLASLPAFPRLPPKPAFCRPCLISLFLLRSARPYCCQPASHHCFLPSGVVCAVLLLAAVNPIYKALEGPANYFASLDLPEPLVHWGHPGNMAVVRRLSWPQA